MTPKSLLYVALVVEAACWTAPATAEAPTTATPIAGAQATGVRSPETCAEAGERLHVRVCRRDDNLEWTVTNRTGVDLWAFVAPPAGPVGGFDRANAIARMGDGHLLLTKMQAPPYGGELHPTGVVKLAPGEHDTGVVTIGRRVNASAPNFTGVAVRGSSYVLTVALEVAFAEARPGDRVTAAPKPYPFQLLLGFRQEREEIVRSPPIRWP